MSAIESPLPDFSRQDIIQVFEKQRQNQQQVADSPPRQRKAKLAHLLEVLLRYRNRIRDALNEDFAKHPVEVDLAELYPVIGEIKHARRQLHRWMRPRRVSTPWAQFGGTSRIQYEPKGTVLIMSPWNFPVNLTLGPLVGAIAAGNTAILKPSEFTPNSTAAMAEIVRLVFSEQEVALIQGTADVASQLLELPFNHIFFTGSTAVGKIVMAAAAKHLASVTLELGGRSPSIVDDSADLRTAAKRVAWSKFINNGQVCIATDHVYVHRSRHDEFLDLLHGYLETFYGADPKTSSSYNRLVNQRHFDRVRNLLRDAEAKRALVPYGGECDETDKFIAPTVLTNLDAKSRILQEEIFGPVLPIQTFSEIEEPVEQINSNEKPLALYIYSRNKRNIRFLLQNSRAGGTCINHSCLHFFNHSLPFGGVNHSGIGKSHGRFSFEAFSNARAIYRQRLPWSAIDLMMPPYTDAKQKLVDITLRWF